MSSTNAASAVALSGYLNTAQTLSALTGSPGTAPTTLSGLASGIDTTTIISELMSVAAAPQAALQAKLTTVDNTLTDWNSLSADATQLQQQADTLSQPSQWNSYTASSSSAGVTATAGSGATGGSLTFTVDHLATAASLITNGSVSSTNQQITSAPSLLVARGASALGLGALSGTLALGAHTVSVTASASGATVTSTGPPFTVTTITAGSNDTVDYSINGNAATLTLAPGANLSPAQLAAEIAQASGGALSATFDSSGALVLTTTAQGSSQQLQVTGGNALPTLGIAAGASGTGHDGVVDVDGVATTLSNLTPGSVVTLAGPGGSSLQAKVTGPLTAGSVTANELSTGNGSLTDVAAAVNNANLGISAAAVQVAAGRYRLEMTSGTTGTASDISLDPGALDGIGGTSVLTAGADAQLSMGDGPGAFAVTSPTNTVTGLMPGVSLQLGAADPTTPVTVSLNPDAAGMATKVATLVSAANAMIADLNTATTLPKSATGTTTGAGTPPPAGTSALQGLLLGDPAASNLLDSVLGAVSGQAGANSTGAAGLVGVSMASNGTLAFDQTAFEAAYAADPTKVANTFTQGATSSNPLMSMYEATDSTGAGAHQVSVTRAASQAAVTGTPPPGAAISGPETISVQLQGVTASYQAQSGESLAAIATGLNTATASAGVGVEAAVVNGSLALTSVAYGSVGTFAVKSTATGSGSTGIAGTADTWETYTGTDVAGTIDGQAATGTGQLLLGALGTASQGLLVQVNATQAQLDAPGAAVATIGYTPGLAQSLATAALGAVNPSGGSIVNSVAGLQSQATDLKTQIADWNPILAAKQLQLQEEYDAMETALAGLNSTKSQLGQAFGSSSTSTGG